MTVNAEQRSAERISVPPGALSRTRVLDLSSRFSYYTGKLFANMGADVILVEPPGGCALRAQGPYLLDRPDPELGVAFNYLNAGKRSITLDLDSPADVKRLHALAATADLVIEDSVPGTAGARGFDYESLAAIQPRLVVTSITPFGQTGPYATSEATDLTLLAMGGLLKMMGYPDRAPTQAYGSQAVAMGCLFGAVGSMLGLLVAQGGGQGQHVDVAIQEAVTMATETAFQTYDLEGRVRNRFGDVQRHAGTGVFQCDDGYIYLFAGGMGAARFWGNLVRWLRDENVPGSEVLTTPEWSHTPYLDTPEAKRIFNGIFPQFCVGKTKMQMYHEGQRRQVPLCPINDMADVVNNEQLRHRQLMVSVWNDRIGADMTMPGVPFKMSVTPGGVRSRAPGLGEHNAEVFNQTAEAA